MNRKARALVCGLLWVICASPTLAAAFLRQQPAAAVSGGTPAPVPEPRAAFEPTASDVARVVSTAAVTRFEGLRVRDIQFRGAATSDLDRLRSLLPLHVNEPLNRDKLRQSIQALFQTGKFADVKVEAERTSNAEVTLVFVAKENYFVGDISLQGAPHAPPTYNQLITASKLQLGELFTQEKLDRAIARMKQTLQDNGYYRAAVTAQLKKYPEIQQADIIFQVTAEKRARIGQVMVRGNPGYSIAEVQKIAKLKTGDKLTSPNISRALERLRKRYQKKQRLEAQVSLIGRDYHPDTDTADLTFRIERGPTVDIRVEGARIRKGLLKKYVPVYEENAVDDDLLNEGLRNLRDYFQTKGYFEVKIEVAQQVQGDQKLVIYDVDLGEKHKLEAVDIQGNRLFGDEEIRERLKIQPAGILLRHGLFSQSMLSRDVEAIENLYRSNGLQQVAVKSDVQDDHKGKKGDIRVLIHINEGAQTLVSSLKIEGNTAISEEEIRSEMINAKEGQAFSTSKLAEDRDRVLTEYFNRGFPNAQFEYFFKESSSDPPRMEVVYKITEGLQVFVDRVLISGLEHTRPWVVTRELQIHDDDPLNQEAMLNTQTKLYDLGIFNEADVAVQNPEGQAPAKNVLMQLQEARPYTFTYGAGLQVQPGGPGSQNPQGGTAISPQVSFDVTRINFLGRDHTVAFSARAGRLQQRALVSYEFPWFMNRHNWKLIFTTFYDNTSDVRTFTAERLEGSIQAEQQVDKAITLLYRFAYRRVRVDPATLAIDPNLIPLLSRPVRVGMPGLSFIRDKRDDPIDSHYGSYNTLDLGVSAGAFGSEASFTRAVLTNSTYYQLRGKNPRTGWVLARSARIGFEGPFGNSRPIPLPELFFAGGSSSHRGFGLNQAGPRDLDTGFPIGGETVFTHMMELRLQPLMLPFIGDNLRPVLFHDMGNVFTSARQFFRSLGKVSQESKQQCQTIPSVTCDFNYMSHAVGLGVRYATPIGPVRVDLGYNLNPPTFPVNREGRFDTLRHFNFYFSIGQTF